MTVVGFRCFKEALACVVLDGSLAEPHVVVSQHTPMPKTGRGDQLVWLRQEIVEILERVRPIAVAFKAAEPMAQKKDLGRAEAEGVLQEAVRSWGAEPLRRVKSQIRADVGFSRATRYLGELLEPEELKVLPENRREAALAALAALARA